MAKLFRMQILDSFDELLEIKPAQAHLKLACVLDILEHLSITRIVKHNIETFIIQFSIFFDNFALSVALQIYYIGMR